MFFPGYAMTLLNGLGPMLRRPAGTMPPVLALLVVSAVSSLAVPPTPPDLVASRLPDDRPDMRLEEVGLNRSCLAWLLLPKDRPDMTISFRRHDRPSLYAGRLPLDRYELDLDLVRAQRPALYGRRLPMSRDAISLDLQAPTRADLYASYLKARLHADLDLRYVPRTRSNLSTRFMKYLPPSLYLRRTMIDRPDLRL